MHHYLISSARDGRTRDGSVRRRGHWVLPCQTGLTGHVTGLTACTGHPQQVPILAVNRLQSMRASDRASHH